MAENSGSKRPAGYNHRSDIAVDGKIVAKEKIRTEGDIEAAGRIVSDGGLVVEGGSEFSGEVTAEHLTTTGDTTVGGVLQVSGATSLDGGASLGGDIVIRDGASVLGDLSVAGGITTLGGETKVTGSAELSGKTLVTGPMAVGTDAEPSKLTLHMGTESGSGLTVDGLAEFKGATVHTGKTTLAETEVTEDARFDGNVLIDGNLEVKGNVIHGDEIKQDSLEVDGSAYFHGDVSVGAHDEASGKPTVSIDSKRLTITSGETVIGGDTTLAGTTKVDGDLVVTGNIIHGDEEGQDEMVVRDILKVGKKSASITDEDGNVTDMFALTVDKDGAKLDGSFTQTGDLDRVGRTNLEGDAEVSGGVTVTVPAGKAVKVVGPVGVIGKTDIVGDTAVTGTLGVTGNAKFDSDTHIVGNLVVDGDIIHGDGEGTDTQTVRDVFRAGRHDTSDGTEDYSLIANHSDVALKSGTGGSISIIGPTSVVGAATIEGKTAIHGDTTVENATDVHIQAERNLELVGNGTVSVSGGPVSVDGRTTFADDVTVKGAETVEGALEVRGGASISGNTMDIVTGSLDIVVPHTSIDGKLSVDASSAGEGVEISGDTSIFGKEKVTKGLEVTLGTVTDTLNTGSLTVTGATSVKNVSVDGSVNVIADGAGESVKVVGPATVTSLDIDRDLAVKGSETVTGTLDVSGKVTVPEIEVKGAMNVAGDVGFKGNLTSAKPLIVGTALAPVETTLHDTLTVGDTVNQNGSATIYGGNKTSALEVQGTAKVTKNLNIGSSATIGAGLNVAAGNTTLQKTDIEGELSTKHIISADDIILATRIFVKDASTEPSKFNEVSATKLVVGTGGTEVHSLDVKDKLTAVSGVITTLSSGALSADTAAVAHNLDVTGTATIGEVFSAKKGATVQNGLTADSLAVTGTSTLKDANVTGTASIVSVDATTVKAGTLNVTGSAKLVSPSVTDLSLTEDIGVTPSTVLVASEGKLVKSSVITTAELGTLKGAKSALQAQIDALSSKTDQGTADVLAEAKRYADEKVAASVATLYRPMGSVDAAGFAALTPADSNIGNVYNLSENTNINVLGTGVMTEVPAGTNVVWTAEGWDVLAGDIDLSEYQKTIAPGKGLEMPDSRTVAHKSALLTGVAGQTYGHVDAIPSITLDEMGHVVAITENDTVYPIRAAPGQHGQFLSATPDQLDADGNILQRGELVWLNGVSLSECAHGQVTPASGGALFDLKTVVDAKVAETEEFISGAVRDAVVVDNVLTVTKGNGDTVDYTITDVNVGQDSVADDRAYPILVKESPDSVSSVGKTKFAGAVTITPSAGSVKATRFIGALTGDVTGNLDGNAATTTKLVQSHKFLTNLSSTLEVEFDGTSDNSHGVTGVLAARNGGTGQTDLSAVHVGYATYDQQGNQIDEHYIPRADAESAFATKAELKDQITWSEDGSTTSSAASVEYKFIGSETIS